MQIELDEQFRINPSDDLNGLKFAPPGFDAQGLKCRSCWWKGNFVIRMLEVFRTHIFLGSKC